MSHGLPRFRLKFHTSALEPERGFSVGAARPRNEAKIVGARRGHPALLGISRFAAAQTVWEARQRRKVPRMVLPCGKFVVDRVAEHAA
jgi:hypothetical protein